MDIYNTFVTSAISITCQIKGRRGLIVSGCFLSHFSLYIVYLGYWNYQVGYPLLSNIQPYFTEVIQPNIRQFTLLYQTNWHYPAGYPTIYSFISNKIDIIQPDIRPNQISGPNPLLDINLPESCNLQPLPLARHI